MEKFTQHTGVAAPLLRDNIDTDAIIPSREMKAVSKHGLGEGLFAGWRYLGAAGRNRAPGFVLNQPAYADTSILLSGNNFGCGSSREHAVWALRDYGIRAIVAAGFGEIFFNNCIANGILPATLPLDDIVTLAAISAADPAGNRLLIDLETRLIHCADAQFHFALEDEPRTMLLEGLDPIDFTLKRAAAIADFEEKDQLRRPWAYL